MICAKPSKDNDANTKYRTVSCFYIINNPKSLHLSSKQILDNREGYNEDASRIT